MVVALLVTLTLFASTALAAEKKAPPAKKPAAATEKPAPAPVEKPAPPPIPLHSIEGTSGIFMTPTAYIANPPHLHKWFGMPSVSATYIKLGHKDVRSTAVTWALHERLELGYAYERLDLGPLGIGLPAPVGFVGPPGPEAVDLEDPPDRLGPPLEAAEPVGVFRPASGEPVFHQAEKALQDGSAALTDVGA